MFGLNSVNPWKFFWIGALTSIISGSFIFYFAQSHLRIVGVTQYVKHPEQFEVSIKTTILNGDTVKIDTIVSYR